MDPGNLVAITAVSISCQPWTSAFAKYARPFQWLHGCNIFSKIDLFMNYHQFPVAAAGIPKMVIIMPFGLFEYLFMPFGLSNAAQTFQQMMDHTTDGLKGVFAYTDDSHVGSPDRKTHLLYLEAFFNALATNGLAINLKKRVFAVPSLEILGHMILRRQDQPPQPVTPPKYNQATATFSRQGEFLPPLFAQLHT
jgi:hypothetical protein